MIPTTAMIGSRAKSIGMTTEAGAMDSALVIQKCAVSPATPIRQTHGKVLRIWQGDVTVKACEDQAKAGLDRGEEEHDASDGFGLGQFARGRLQSGQKQSRKGPPR